MKMCFTGGHSRLPGIAFEQILGDAILLHRSAFASNPNDDQLMHLSEYHWRQNPQAELHINHPVGFDFENVPHI